MVVWCGAESEESNCDEKSATLRIRFVDNTFHSAIGSHPAKDVEVRYM